MKNEYYDEYPTVSIVVTDNGYLCEIDNVPVSDGYTIRKRVFHNLQNCMDWILDETRDNAYGTTFLTGEGEDECDVFDKKDDDDEEEERVEDEYPSTKLEGEE